MSSLTEIRPSDATITTTNQFFESGKVQEESENIHKIHAM